MMGHWQKQTELWVEPVHLGRRIPKDYILRKISKALDLRESGGQSGSRICSGESLQVILRFPSSDHGLADYRGDCVRATR